MENSIGIYSFSEYEEEQQDFYWEEMDYNKDNNEENNYSCYSKEESQDWWNLQLSDFQDDDDIKRMMF